MDGLGSNIFANALLMAAYIAYKALDRCLHSKCKYSTVDGFTFDIDGQEDAECPATDMERMADLLKSRAMVFRRGATARIEKLEPLQQPAGQQQPAGPAGQQRGEIV